MAPFSYRDKVALITGGSRGLGLEIARQICARGAKVALIARDPEELARAKTELDRLATEVLTIQCDLLESAQIQSAVQQTLQRFGRIDILINNAGMIEVDPRSEEHTSELQSHHDLVCRLLLEKKKKKNSS